MFSINSKDSKPIFEQIIDQVSRYIALGVLEDDEQLPPVRALARDLGINPNTVSKAYHECEMLGLIYSVPGKGSYVSPNQKGVDSVINNAYKKIEESYLDLLRLGEDEIEIFNFLKEVQHDWIYQR